MLPVNQYKINELYFKVKHNDIMIDFPLFIDNLNGINLVESINSKGITGKISFLDVNNYNELFPLVGGEKLYMSITDTFGKTFEMNFIVEQKLEVQKKDATFYSYVTLSLFQEEYFNLITKNYVMGIGENISSLNDIISKLLDTCGTKLSPDSMQIGNKIKNISFPMGWTLNNILDYLLNKNHDNSQFGNRLYWDKTKKMFFLNTLTNMNKNNNIKREFTFLDRYSFNFITDYSTAKDKQVTEFTNSGVGTINTCNCDLQNKKVIVKKSEFKDYMETTNTKFSTVSEDVVDISSKNSNFYVYKPFLYTDSDLDSINNRREEYINSDIILSINVNGRIDLELGEKITLYYQTKDNTENIFSGEWIVTDISHMFNSNALYRQILTVRKSGIVTKSKTNRLFENR